MLKKKCISFFAGAGLQPAPARIMGRDRQGQFLPPVIGMVRAPQRIDMVMVTATIVAASTSMGAIPASFFMTPSLLSYSAMIQKEGLRRD
ncbi:MAG: hypothetical protein A2X93_04600 [Deltaproteobacteria bacterium GWC2_56_8]|nr:MAG: hypothetical protein A2X93_04600 [Deltaproteobacteria bacterium GWC2_56_8]